MILSVKWNIASKGTFGVPSIYSSPDRQPTRSPNAPTSSPQSYLQPTTPESSRKRSILVYNLLLSDTGANHSALGVEA